MVPLPASMTISTRSPFMGALLGMWGAASWGPTPPGQPRPAVETPDVAGSWGCPGRALVASRRVAHPWVALW
ncbi:hypothetical protein GCM10010210_15440 [Pseudonocardia hydrocarbonoxydans]|uniref:Uncharacterized protein n=1 Tax=Pseudonocardia hydrocarbonoxydans TaxID=76726 RepID=A0A4Y3WQQ6_9PSEU|nr:hypothetical protein PHY01_34480 [Pseudonocardia hydrocarbonoxydans]